jgi:type IV pilus assembly protein PilV
VYVSTRSLLRSTQRGFTIIEVMVALVVMSIGLLGIAKMQALSVASTSTSRLRSLAAYEAAGMASAMRANRTYWSGASLAKPISVSGGAASSTDATLSSAITTVGLGSVDYCVSGGGAPCKPVTMAANDLQSWAAELNTLLPNSTALITCPTLTVPATCTIQITWDEKAVAMNKQAAAVTSTTANYRLPTYVLYVQP